MRYIREDPHHVRTILLLYGLMVCLGYLLAMSLPAAWAYVTCILTLLLAIPFTVFCQYWQSDEDDPYRQEMITPLALTSGAGGTVFYLFNGQFFFGLIDIPTIFILATLLAYGLCFVTARLAEPALARVRLFVDAEDYTICMQCGYDLTGNVSGRCPECGATRDCPRCRRPASYLQQGVCVHCGHSWRTVETPVFDEGTATPLREKK